MNVAINGVGRIGRLVFRQALKNSCINLVAVNDLISTDQLAYLLKYDSTHGQLQRELSFTKDSITIDDVTVKVFNEKDPAKLPWKELGVSYVVESTGKFTKEAEARKHLEAGAERVIISAPAGEGIPTFVMGVNHEKYNPATDHIISNASCTTNCLAPITKVLLENFGIEEGLMTTVHAMTSGQATVDGPAQKDWRRGRGAMQNIVPATTGAAKAVALCLPEVKGKLTGMAFRVPIPDVSVIDLTVKLSKPTSYEMICEKMKQAAEGSMKGILYYCEDQVVSSDFIGSHYSAIFDAKAGIALNNKFFKLIAWYDNEMGYSTRVVDLIEYMAKREQKVKA
ncbi:MAG: type I glyceraldehyde-3-phosphate dehydrogenase [Chlamydiales bacterium]